MCAKCKDLNSRTSTYPCLPDCFLLGCGGAEVDIIASSQKPSELLLLDLFICPACFSAPQAPSFAQLEAIVGEVLHTLAALRDMFWKENIQAAFNV